MTQKTKTAKSKPKNEAKTEEKITVADKMPTAGQRAVHFRALAIIGVAAACGLSVCAPHTLLFLAPHVLRLHTFCIVQLLAVFGTGLWPFTCTQPRTLTL
jgi:hypothetical protein